MRQSLVQRSGWQLGEMADEAVHRPHLYQSAHAAGGGSARARKLERQSADFGGPTDSRRPTPPAESSRRKARAASYCIRREGIVRAPDPLAIASDLRRSTTRVAPAFDCRRKEERVERWPGLPDLARRRSAGVAAPLARGCRENSDDGLRRSGLGLTCGKTDLVGVVRGDLSTWAGPPLIAHLGGRVGRRVT